MCPCPQGQSHQTGESRVQEALHLSRGDGDDDGNGDDDGGDHDGGDDEQS